MLSGKGVAPFHVVRSHQLEGAVFSDGDQDMLDAEQARRDCLVLLDHLSPNWRT
jgi:hypothetical protein